MPRLNTDELSTQTQEVMELIDAGNNFLVSGGAGSGKTYSLVEVLRAVISNNPLSNIASITYTNAAVDEIEERVDHENLFVSTIHEFLWNNIKHFQIELKKIVIELINDETQALFKKPEDDEVDNTFFDDLEIGIQYKEFVKIHEGIISHDELIILAHRIYEKYPKLCSITKDTYPYIFVDEYQDTDPKVIQILLTHLEQSTKSNIVGFFGDSMQSIYDGSIGDLDRYIDIDQPLITEVTIDQNRRNPQLIIDLANQLRRDGILQLPSEDLAAPNMNANGSVKQGSIRFIHSNNDDLNVVRQYLDWDFSDIKNTKELNLTHNLIAQKAGFVDLMRIYNADKILEFVKRVKKHIKDQDVDINTENKSFEEVLIELNGVVNKTPVQNSYIENHPEVYNLALEQPYDVISKLYVDKDQLIDNNKNDSDSENKPVTNRDDLIKHLFKIEHSIWLYSTGQYNEFLRKTDYSIKSIEDKDKLKNNVEQLIQVNDQSIGSVIEKANEFGIVNVDDRLQIFKAKKYYIYNQVSTLPYNQFQSLYQYLEGFTPFSTQHKIKGAQFNNVFVILDNGRWNNYNFTNLFSGQGTESVLKRSQKIFYVCCTRTKENLAVFFHNPSPIVIGRAKEWFGVENVICLDQ